MKKRGGIRTCTDCGQDDLMGDSENYVEEAAPEAHECVCENEDFELVSGVSCMTAHMRRAGTTLLAASWNAI